MEKCKERIEKIIRTYILSNECAGEIDHSVLKNMKDLKIVCKDKNGTVIGLVLNNRIIVYRYTEQSVETTDYELESYVEMPNKDESRYAIHLRDYNGSEELKNDMDSKINDWRAQYNVEMITDYKIFDDILAELKEHRKYILGQA